MRLRKLIRATENKYNRLLSILVLSYIASPFLLDQTIGNLIVFFVFSGAIIAVVYQIQGSKKAFKFYIILMLLAWLLRSISYASLLSLTLNRFFESFSTIILLTFFALSAYIILQELARAEQVTADIIKGGICVYFLFGFFWTGMYDIIYNFDANSFNAASETISRADLNHFSFTTLTTVGYGDISPASEIARVLANLEGMVGVMYPSIFIARLVSLHSSR